MQEGTKKLCYWASQLYQNELFHADEIYDKLVNSKSRLKPVSKSKQLVGYILYNHFNFTQEMIASEFNLVNHSTIVYWLDRVQSELKTNKRMQYRYNLMKDVIDGKEIKVIKHRPKYFNRHTLSDADKQFIKDNINNGFCVSYFADVLNKTRKTVKDYLTFVTKDNDIFTAPKITRFRVHSFNKRKEIDY
jgi:hypothetical protein